MLALLRTTSAIIGRPPMAEDTMLPTPLPNSSLFMSERRWKGSSLSTASAVSRDSRLATNTYSKIHLIAGPDRMALKSGPVKPASKPPSPRSSRGPAPLTSAIPVPTMTATNGAGTTLEMLPSLGQNTMISTAASPTRAVAGTRLAKLGGIDVRIRMPCSLGFSRPSATWI